MLQILSLTISFPIIHDNNSLHYCYNAEYIKHCFNKWHLDELKETWDDSTSKHIHKHPHDYIKYYNDIKYHMTLL